MWHRSSLLRYYTEWYVVCLYGMFMAFNAVTKVWLHGAYHMKNVNVVISLKAMS